MRVRVVLALVTGSAVLATASLLTACTKTPAVPVTCATYEKDGTWYEPDHEPFHDDDPCDTDDRDNHVKHPKTKKPEPKPLKTARQPAPPVRTKR